jgi:hypothetical protein
MGSEATQERSQLTDFVPMSRRRSVFPVLVPPEDIEITYGNRYPRYKKEQIVVYSLSDSTQHIITTGNSTLYEVLFMLTIQVQLYHSS